MIGRSSSGKTNLCAMLLQDIFYGAGVGVLALEQELLTEEILPYIHENRIDDVVYVNPADSTAPIAFNPLHLDPGESIEEKVEDFVTIFKRAALASATGAARSSCIWGSRKHPCATRFSS
jgi:hypothetical protein